MTSLQKTLFEFGKLGLRRLKCGFVVGAHIEEHAGLRRLHRNLFELVNELLPLFVDLGAFQKFLLICGECFSQQRADVFFDFLNLLSNIREVRLSA